MLAAEGAFAMDEIPAVDADHMGIHADCSRVMYLCVMQHGVDPWI
jgi:hypothetical protein